MTEPNHEGTEAIVLRCADGRLHRDYPNTPVATAETWECAVGAGEFMDEPRADGTGWHCGPHAADRVPVTAL